MAAHSGGVDWAAVVKPILSPNYGVLNNSDILNLVKTILKCENEILDHDESHESFYMAFVALSADVISGQCNSINQAQIPQVTEATNILIRYLLNRLGTLNNSEYKLLLAPLKSLCEGKNFVQNLEQVILTSILRNSKHPEHIKTNVPGGEKESPKSEMKRSRSDLSTVILQQLTTPVGSSMLAWSPLIEDQADCSLTFTKSNINFLNINNAGDIILNVCTSLSVLLRYRNKYEESTLKGRPLFLPLTNSEATIVKNALPQIAADISVLSLAVSLPIVDPLTPRKIIQLSQCAMSALYCAVMTSVSASVLSMQTSSTSQKSASSSTLTTQTTTNPTFNNAQNSGQKDADLIAAEDHSRMIVDKALEIFTTIGEIFKNSTRSHIYQNHLCMGAWLLITGIQGAMGASGNSGGAKQTQSNVNVEPENTKVSRSPSKSGESLQLIPPTSRVNLFKVQQGFGVLNVAIASSSLTLMTELIEDLRIESRSGDDSAAASGNIEPSGFDILGQYSALQRVVRVVNSATLQQLLTFLATVSYRKACTLKRVNAKNPTDGAEPVSYSDSTTFLNDTFSCSEDSETEEEEEEEDSESYLGLWLKETLSPETAEEPADIENQDKTTENQQRGNTLVSVKDEPHEYLELSAQIFTFLDTALGSNHKFLSKYVKSSLSEQQMILLANILKDLDRDASRSDPECVQWQNSMIKFSGSLGRYLHNLISGNLLNESLQSSLLLHLGVSPWTQDSNIWPLQVYSRTLAVLVQILLLKPSLEKEAACLSVWHRLVNTLVEGVCSTSQLSDDYEDLNVEHAQLLLFLFHSLNLMQKKSILLLTAGGVIRCAEVCRTVSPEKSLRDSQIMLLSRLLLFLEYLMKHLYNAPTVLLEQVRWNLFSIITMDTTQKASDLINAKTKMSFFLKDIEEKHRKLTNDYTALNSVRPKFYSLTVIETKIQPEFKLDGLAWNFILCTPDKLKYPLLVDALVDILGVTDITMGKIPYQTNCAIHYCFNLCWKLLLGLPPSTPHVESLMQDRTPNLHSLIWSIRCLHPIPHSHYLIVNSCVKQGMYTQYAETLWNKVTEHVSDVRYSLKETILELDSFTKSFQIQSPRLSKIILLDSVLSHLFAICWAEKEGIKPKSSQTFGSAPISCTSTPQDVVVSQGNTSIDLDGTKSSVENSGNIVEILPREELNKNLLEKLADTIEILRECMFKTMTKNLNGPIPNNLMESLIAISSGKNPFWLNIGLQFIQQLNGQTVKDIIVTEWNKNLNVVGEDNLTTTLPSASSNTLNYPVELHTLSVIDAHLTEISRTSNYTFLSSMKHTLKSLFYLLYHLINNNNSGQLSKIEERLKNLLIPMLFDMRTEYLYDIINRCLEKIFGITQDNGNTSPSTNLSNVTFNIVTSDSYQLSSYAHLLKISYHILIDYAELSREGRNTGLDETILHQILKYWEQMLDKPMALKAMHDFFYTTSERNIPNDSNGSLVSILLSFSNTSMSQAYSTRILQFFEKLFQTSEQTDALFTLDQVCSSVSELGNTEPQRLRSWLSHILLGPGLSKTGMPISGGASSSDVQTPTNMATTVSGTMPVSISEQVATLQSTADMVLDADAEDIDTGGVAAIVADADAMDIDEECTPGGQGCAITTAGTSTAAWQSSQVHRSGADTPNEECLEKNGRLLQTLTKYIVSENRISPNVSSALFQALIQLGQILLCPTQDALEFSDLLQVMVTLADSGQGKGHSMLFSAAIDWLDTSKNHILERHIPKLMENSKASVTFDNITALLRYLTDLLQLLGPTGARALTPSWDDDMSPDVDELIEESNGIGTACAQDADEDSAVEDSDEDSLSNKLCTFSITQKEFMNQHWYHCHTCKMVDGVGVCSVCARVCHRGHDISYAKYGNFFCDCGAKEDGSCQALSRRTSTAGGQSNSIQDTSILGNSSVLGPTSSSSDVDQIIPSLRRRPSSPPSQNNGGKAFGDVSTTTMVKAVDASKETLTNIEHWRNVVKCLLTFFNSLLPAIDVNCARHSTVGCHKRARKAIERLHKVEKTFTVSDQIMVATLGSQEGAFENVRMNYSGEQGQTIRQLLSTNRVRRVALCCLASPHGKRQHLAVSHEKGKVTILQLSALLKQADAAKRKLTLTRLASAPIPCTVLSLASNPVNEDFLAVCGLKECHILTFASSGAANEHIVLTPQLETGNYIMRAIWLPGSQTSLALVTADFVKIYDLSEDSLSPQYYFLVPSGKIRDCCFVYQEGAYFMLLMASSGYIYTQPLEQESHARHGAFYVTNTLELEHPYIKDVNGLIGGGGVSIYYSHMLQMLFYSYAQGKSFMSPLVDVNVGVKCTIQLQTSSGNSCNAATSIVKSEHTNNNNNNAATSTTNGAANVNNGITSSSSTSSSKNSTSKGPPQPLCQWTEIVGHPGIVCAMMQTSNNPVIFMLKPDGVVVQEIKAQSSKAKIMDMVAIRHLVSGQEKTTLILLCEDGSLRIYAAHTENTCYWLSAEVQPVVVSAAQWYGTGFIQRSGPFNRRGKIRGALGKNSNGQSNSNGDKSTSNKSGTGTTSTPVFPIDFFEHCTVITDIEFGGNDLLQIYNTQQLKHRLNSTGLYVASSKQNGFTLEINNNDPNMIMTGIRILIGTQDPLRAPLSVSMHGRTVNTVAPRPRWFDLPLTREESLLSDKKLSVSFGSSQDPENVCMLDCIKVYGKTKYIFGWPEETDEVTAASAVNGGSSNNNGVNTASGVGQNANGASDADGAGGTLSASTITPLDQMITSMLEVLDSALGLLGNQLPEDIKTRAIETATTLLLYPTPHVVQMQAKYVLATLHPTKQSYQTYKDKEMLIEVNRELKRMMDVTDARQIDPEAFYRMVLIVRSISVARPQNLTKICFEQQCTILPVMLQLMTKLHDITPGYEEPSSIVKRGLTHIEATVYSIVEIIYAYALSDTELIDVMTKYFVTLLLDNSPVISHSTKTAMIRLLRPRIKRRRVLIGSPLNCSTPTPAGTQNVNETFSASASSAPGPSFSNTAPGGNDIIRGMRDIEAMESLSLEDAVAVAANNIAGSANNANPQALASLEALLEINGFPQLMELQQDADDESIMDIAIALSLGEPDVDLHAIQQALPNLRGIRGRSLGSLHTIRLPDGAYSNDATASAGGSDDEGSNAATDGSTLRTSPAEPAGSGGSESGGSGVESIGGTSGRSSTYGDQPNPSPPRTSDIQQQTNNDVQDIANNQPVAGTSGNVTNTETGTGQEENDADVSNENETGTKLHNLRMQILDKMIDNFKSLENVNGNQAIPFMQVVLMLTSDIDGNQEIDQQIMTKLLNAFIERLEIKTMASQMIKRTPRTEVNLVVLRFLGVLMGKVKSSSSSKSSSHTQTGASSTTHHHFVPDNSMYVAQTTANTLIKSGTIPYCLVILDSFLPYWRYYATNDDLPTDGLHNPPTAGGFSNLGNANIVATLTTSNLLKPIQYGPVSDMQPFFIRQYVKGSTDVFELYSPVLTEMAVRLPYQILKLSSGHPSSYEYQPLCEVMTLTLCEYMLHLQQVSSTASAAVLRRQVRKLLLYVCGSKEKYRQLRDIHTLDTHMKAAQKRCFDNGNLNAMQSYHQQQQQQVTLSYDALVELTEHLRACQEIASVRTGNWQRFCILHPDVLPSLLRISCFQMEEVVSSIILQLLQSAVCSLKSAADVITSTKSSTNAISNTGLKERRDRDRSSEESEAGQITDSRFDPQQCSALVAQLFNQLQPKTFTRFVRIFLLETNSTSLRWQAHSLVHALYEQSQDGTAAREQLLQCLWSLWPLVPAYGRRTAQFVDLLGYLTLSTPAISTSPRLLDYTAQAVSVLRQQNELLSKHPNAPIYTSLGQVLDLDGFYLESEPCLVCNSPEVPMGSIKLSSIKIDSKFTTTTTIVKLVQSHTISKILLRIGDLKRTKMVKTINVFYNNRTVQAVVELKNRPAMWHKAKRVTLQSGQTDVKIDFPLPIVACNLMIEYADFYETVSGSSESLQCPRCSAAVPANPGVCSNCGENVFQCHKCRAINYDEKDPFLCHSCGFCKYAKFDYSIYGRPCCAVDPIESAEDRSKTVQVIHSSLEKADRVYRQLQANKHMLELLVQKVSEQRLERSNSGMTLDESMFSNIAAATSGTDIISSLAGSRSVTASAAATAAVAVTTSGTTTSSVVGSSQVNKVIQLLAQKYCVESKTSFEELSKIIQKVQACRKELVAYDSSQMDHTTTTNISSKSGDEFPVAINRCYGCALASTEQCLTLLRAMASNWSCRVALCSQGLVDELAQNNLRRGTNQIQDEVRQLLCLLTRDLEVQARGLCTLIADRVRMALSGSVPQANLESAVRHEMALLEALVAQDDSCWEMKLRTVLELFLLASRDQRGPAVAVIRPCLRIVHSLISPPMATSKANKDIKARDLSTIIPAEGVTVNYEQWLAGVDQHGYDMWKSRMPLVPSISGTVKEQQPSAPGTELDIVSANIDGQKPRMFCAVLEQKRLEYRSAYLMEKYGKRWRNKILQKGVPNPPLELSASWLQPLLFNSNSRFARKMAFSMVISLTRTAERKREVLNLLTGFLQYIGDAGEASGEFILLYRALANETPWRQYLALRGVLTLIADLLFAEIEKIHRLEETTLSSDLAQGFALQALVELMAMFLESPSIRQAYKGRLLGPVLQSYLSLRKLVVQRTHLIDYAQEKLLEMLEEMTTGTEEETRAFMAVLIDTVQKTPMNDIKTPVFIFERLCSIIHPEENNVGEFFLTLEKDPQQEDFLQGRMLGNPYPSTEAGLGPLMRDVKNKICSDCELVALLEDDNGMELLVHNKIISLDLPVKDVYKKIWLAEGGERDAMRVVYRMRGLLGDATEEFVETLNNKSKEEIDNEQMYRMANVLADCGGLKVMLDRIASLPNVGRIRPLLSVLLKLFLLSVKVRRCQEVLCQPELGAINTLLKVLQLCLQSETDITGAVSNTNATSGMSNMQSTANTTNTTALQSAVTEQLLEIMETILSKAASDTLDSFLQFSLTFGGPEYVQALISCTNCPNVRNSSSVLRHLIRVLAALVYGNDIKMSLLCEHFKNALDFDLFDTEHTNEDEFKMELFCVLTNQIEHNSIGGTLKDYIISLGIVDRALDYIIKYAPCVKPTLLRTDSDELKEFISRPSLKYLLRFLTGLATRHELTQLSLSKDPIIPIIHRLEQVSSDEHVGSLAENLLEALCTDHITAKRVQEVREFTRAEKKRLAMATREKQLDALGMRTNEKGQVTAKGSILQKIEKLRDETGLTCFICREGYACQPTKVLGIYTFTKRTNVEEFEIKSRKTIGYTTVTHFNVVHIDCHMSAIRLARGRDEWESASLQNANTRCNGLLPLWGPDVLESAFSSCMSRHNAYMQESTQRCEITFSSAVHDLKLLLQRFALEKSFHDDAGGGGPQSNMHFIPYLLFYSLYILLSSRSSAREEKTLTAYLNLLPCERWLETAYEVEGPFYQVTLSLALHTPEIWSRNRLQHLKRLIAIGHARHVSPNILCKFLVDNDRQVKSYSVYKPYLMMWSIVDLIYNYILRSITSLKDEDWPITLFSYIRSHDELMIKSSDNILSTFTDEYLPCTTFAEFCDFAGLLNEIEDPDNFLQQVVHSMPSSATSASSQAQSGAAATVSTASSSAVASNVNNTSSSGNGPQSGGGQNA